MATWDSAYLLQSFNRKAGRPTTDAITDAQKYERLSDAQNRIIARMMGVVPYSLYPHVATASLPQLTITGSIGTFGNDTNGYAKFPMGKGNIFQSVNDIPGNPFLDYLSEGNQIRAKNGNSLPATLYWYGISQPADITATDQPAITPEPARELIVLEAVRQFAQEFLRNPALTDEMSNEIEERAWPTWCLAWKTQYRSGGALNTMTGLDIAIAGQGGGYGYTYAR